MAYKEMREQIAAILAAVDGAGKIVHPLEFDCLGCGSAPTGMSYATPFYVEIQNTLTTDILA